MTRTIGRIVGVRICSRAKRGGTREHTAAVLDSLLVKGSCSLRQEIDTKYSSGGGSLHMMMRLLI